MSGSTISNPVTISVTVGSPGYYSPLTILPVMYSFSGPPPNPPTITGGFVSPTAGVGVYSDLTNASILNQGIIDGASGPRHSAGTGANAVDLFGGGTLTNDGRISGGNANGSAGTGVSIASSTLFNDKSAAITGGEFGGTGLVATAAYISNAGEISGGFGSTNTAGIGVILTASTLINTGSILGGLPTLGGVRLYAASTLVNSGRVSGAAGAWSIYVASGSVTNATGGTIAANQYTGQGVDLSSGATLVNQGFIGLPAGYTIEGSVGGTGVLLPSGAVLTNTGTIDGMGSATTLAGGTGVMVVNDSFTNAGTIAGGEGLGTTFGAAGFGTIAGHGGAAVSLNGGSVTNAGSITGGEAFGTTGATGGPGVLVTAGSLTNNATIAGGGDPYTAGALGGPGIDLQAGAVVNNATVSGGDQDGAPGAGADVSGGSLTNNGTVSGSDGIDVVTGGTGGIFIDNTDRIAASGADGVSIAAAASVVNSGMISGPTAAVAMSAGGSFTNTGSGTLAGGGAGVTAAVYGVTASAAASVVNLGKITIAIGYLFGTGVKLSAGGTIVNGSPTDQTASVAGADNGFGIAVTGGSLANYGVVTTGGFSPTVQTAGVLLTASRGTNQGTIVGGGGAGGHGAVDAGTGHVGYAGGAGVLLTNSTLANSGTLVGGVGGEGGYGVYGSAQSAPGGPGGPGVLVNGGMLVNTGTLLGGTGGTGGNHGINSQEIPNSPNGPGGNGVNVTAGLLSNVGTAIGAAATGGGVVAGYGALISGGTLVNSGLVAGGAGTPGLEGALGGSVIEGGIGGIGLVQTGGTVSNTGSIVGGTGTSDVAGGAGVRLTGGSFTNMGLVEGANSGPGGTYSYSGGTGLYLTGATATNAGTIVGGALGAGTIGAGAPGAAVAFGPAAATLIVDPGAVFSGNVKGNSTVADALVLGAGHGPGTLDMGGSFSALSVLQFSPGGNWTLAGGVGPLASGQAIDGFTFGDTIVVEGFVETGHSFVPGTGLELTGATSATLGIVGDFSTTSFHVGTIGGDTRISVACYVAGTRIATTRGKVPVEHLSEGDLVLNSDGEAVPVRWIGHRRIDCRRHPNPASVWPVRVNAGAFAAGSPERDLWLSADHGVFVDGVLIPIKHLINGTTVARVPLDAVTYYHVELPRHDAILAEGLAAESYLDTGQRAQFANGGEVVRLFPDFSARGGDIALLWEVCGCAPLVVAGPIVDRVRARLKQARGSAPVPARGQAP